jgi:hypothetical protein
MAMHPTAATFAAMVDVDGPIRAQMIRAFLLVDPDLTDEDLQAKYWPVVRILVGDMLGRATCPRCNGRGELSAPNDGPSAWIGCQICGGHGYSYDKNLTDVGPLVDDPGVQPGLGPAPTGQVDDLVPWSGPRPWPRPPERP